MTSSPSSPSGRVPPSAIWNNNGNKHNASLHHHSRSPLEVAAAAAITSSIAEETEQQDDRVALLRMPPPSSDGFDEDGDDGGGFNEEEKKDGGNNHYRYGHSDNNHGGSVSNPLHSPVDNGSSTSFPVATGNHDSSSSSALASAASNATASVFGLPSYLTRSLPSTSLLMKRLGRILAISSTAIFLLVVFPLLCRSAIRDYRQGKTDFAAFYSAAGFVVITLVLSFREILSHLHNWYAPDVQKFVVRILFMVPLYSVQSWLSLRFHGPARVYIDTVRDLYEAYVIQSFVYYLIELLGGEDRMADVLSRKDPHLGGHGALMSRCLRRWTMGRQFLLRIKHGVLQYVVVKTVMTLLTTFLFLPCNWYGEGTFSWNYAYVYITTILNVSVCYALYCLVKLFHAVKSDLRSPVNWHPVGKFLCVKGVVFFTWWQGVGIYFLRSHGVIGDVGSWSGDDVAGGIIDYLVCVEMVFFAVAHMFTFTYKEYLPEGMEEKKKSGAVGWLFEGVDKRRRRKTGRGKGPRSYTTLDGWNNGDRRPQASSPSALQSALLDEDEEVTPCIDEDGNIAESSYLAPAPSSGFSKLEDPLSLREALWSSTVPRETYDDIRRLGGGLVGHNQEERMGGGRGENSGIDIGLTSLGSLNNAESI